MIQYIDEFRDPKLALALSEKIRQINTGRKITIMEVCGGHTAAILKNGIRQLLPDNISLVSGPGCPVCVTPAVFIDECLELARRKDVTVCSFGDMLRVPGSDSSLQKERALGADVRVVYSPLDALELARQNPDRQIVMPAIGFETTMPAFAAVLQKAKKENISNFFILAGGKTMPEVMQNLLEKNEVRLDAFICPGHVAAVAGTGIFDFIAEQYSLPCVVTGFEALDILHAVYLILQQLAENRHEVQNQYQRVVTRGGNSTARSVLYSVFTQEDCHWRGIGLVPGSGLALRSDFAGFDARKKFALQLAEKEENSACICGDIMRGVQTPENCRLFRKVCHPDNPQGACMVSAEGTCASYFKYAG